MTPQGIGIAGLLLTDLPAGSDPAVELAVQRSALDLIRLIAPTTRPERLAAAVDGAQGFVYLVARLGVTGASRSLAADLDESIARVRGATRLPIAVGFGISTAEQARSGRSAGRRRGRGQRAGGPPRTAMACAGARRFLRELQGRARSRTGGGVA